MLSNDCYLQLAICDLLSDSFYLKLATSCKNLFLSLVVVRRTSRNFFYPKYFGPKIFLDPTFFWTQHFLDPILFEPHNFGPIIFFGTKKFSDQKFFLTRNFLGPLFSEPTFFQTQKVFPSWTLSTLSLVFIVEQIRF